ncbi:MAG: hypothetical protein RLZZ28_731 [Bacteroidota bacterium]|jgi:tetratricopeptide (TPR) repeat protein
MKKTVALMFTAMLAAQCLMAQIPEGIKLLTYEKNQSAKQVFQKAYDANPKDPQTIYWLGQAILAANGTEPAAADLNTAKALYQKGLQEVGSDPWLLVGMGHIEILQKGDMNSVKQKFEQAITASTETKGKNKGKPSAAILNAIGRANAEVASNMGDHAYAIDKLKQAAAIDPTSADIMVNLGINYLKMGGENGGDAVKAYQEALARDPKNAYAYYRIGKIYQSQNNKELFEQNFNEAIKADPAFPLSYYAYYQYYADKDVNKAKEYLDKFVATADKDPRNEYFLAEYLFRAGKNAESIAKVKELEASAGLTAIPRLSILYAYNYDRMNDSVKAKENIQKFFATAPMDKIEPTDYELAVKVLSKFPGSEAQAVNYLEKALDNDTSRVNKLNYLNQAAEMFGRAKNSSEQLKWIERVLVLKGTTSEADYYKITNTAINAKEHKRALGYAKRYMSAYPDKPQPYTFFRRAALASDPDSAKVIEQLDYLDSVYSGLGKDKYKKEIFNNLYFRLVFYNNKFNNLKKDPDFKVKADGTRTPVVDQFLATCQKAVDVTDQMMLLYTDPADENNKFAADSKASILKTIDYYSKPQTPTKKPPVSGGAGKGK